MIEKLCKNCFRSFPQYNTAQSLCALCSYNRYFKDKKHKPIAKRGKRTIEYEKWRNEVARPYLDKMYGHICSVDGCYETEALDIDHILTRGSRPDLKQELTNVRYLCRQHHQERE